MFCCVMHPPYLGDHTTDVKQEAAKTCVLYLPFWGVLRDIAGPKIITATQRPIQFLSNSLSDVEPARKKAPSVTVT